MIYCHPLQDSFCAAMRDAAVEGLATGHHQVRVTDLYAEEFDPILSAPEWLVHLSPAIGRPDIEAHANNLHWCESLVLIYPTWWSGQPAMLKGYFDRVWLNGVAWTLPPGAERLRPLLRNIRRITIVTSHGSSKFVNVLEGEAGKRVAFRGLRALCSRVCRTRWISFYGIDRSTPEARAAFLSKVRCQLAR